MSLQTHPPTPRVSGTIKGWSPGFTATLSFQRAMFHVGTCRFSRCTAPFPFLTSPGTKNEVCKSKCRLHIYIYVRIHIIYIWKLYKRWCCIHYIFMNHHLPFEFHDFSTFWVWLKTQVTRMMLPRTKLFLYKSLSPGWRPEGPIGSMCGIYIPTYGKKWLHGQGEIMEHLGSGNIILYRYVPWLCFLNILFWCHLLDFWPDYTYVESDDSTWIGKYPLYVLAHSGTGSPGNWITRLEKWTHLLWWCMMNIWTFEKLQGFKDTKCSCHILSMNAYRLLPIMNAKNYMLSYCNNLPGRDFRANDVWVHNGYIMFWEPTMSVMLKLQGPPALVTIALSPLHPISTNHILLMEEIRNPDKTGW